MLKAGVLLVGYCWGRGVSCPRPDLPGRAMTAGLMSKYLLGLLILSFGLLLPQPSQTKSFGGSIHLAWTETVHKELNQLL